ncbi:DUF2218 domain-containing protein [Stakelama sp. CBK3Z-3]|uniref:DUF2218 domain-containing protein n=1 Tax=Stakelama flava TaxID=2860338 RepID=A0ABS6XJP8_9SPHN|nr:DUF2218 domain-containing protein [Stakelama flava]MBW4329626.1 DUF2218 domain-containing protein [Stakelama flava]
MNSATANVPTENGSRYLQQLCKHWSHSLDVDFTPEHGTIIFPRDARGADWDDDAKAVLKAEPENLAIRLEASSAEHLAALKGVLERHLDRFAHREAPLTFDWQAG